MSNFTFNPLQMAIKPFYEQAKAEDELFAQEVQEKESRTEKPKSFAECCDYIMGEAYDYASKNKMSIEGGQQFGMGGCDEAQIISMIKHYYDEDDIKVRKIGANVEPVVKTTATTATPTTKTETKPTKGKKDKKPIRPKETLKNTHIPMVRPTSEKDAKKGSKEQASHIVQMDIWGMLAGE